MRLIDLLIDLHDNGPRLRTVGEELMLQRLERDMAQAASDAERWSILQREGIDELGDRDLGTDVLARIESLRRAALN